MNVPGWCLGGAILLRCCNGSVIGAQSIPGYPTYASAVWGVPADTCFYVDYNSVQAWCNFAQQGGWNFCWTDGAIIGYSLDSSCFSGDGKFIQGYIY
jgi:hypothetical protein